MNDSTLSDSIYAHKDSLTISTGGPCVYVKAPEFKEPVIINSPIYSPPVNPDYIKLAKVAYDTVLQTMIDGEKTHPNNPVNGWKDVNIPTHGLHIVDHIYKHSKGDKTEDHIAHMLTRCAMIKYLEDERK